MTDVKNTPEVTLDDDFKVKNRKGEVIPPDKVRKTGRRIKGIPPMSVVSPYVMNNRIGSSNYIADTVRVDKIEEYIREKKSQGMINFSIMHIFLAAYIRTVSQKPALNRFMQSQRVYARNNIEICLTIKKEMSLEAPDTVVKVYFYPDATVDDVYHELDRVINEYREAPGGAFDSFAGALSYIPGLLLKFAIGTLRFIDYFGLLPRPVTKLSPFHGSLFITSMGSLGIPPIFHHLYDFGNLPVFLSFGSKYRKNVVLDDGSVEKQAFVDFTVVMDERICDGYYYAACLKQIRSLLKNPKQLDVKPEKVVRDIK